MASARLSKTISSSTGKIFTLSVWLKKADNAAINTIFHLTSDSNTNKYIEIASKSGYGIDFQLKNGTSGDNGTYLRRRTTRVLRDLSAWYHIVIRFDSTNSTASDRARIYINGEQATDIDQDSTPDVPLNFVSDLNNANSNLSLAGFVGGSNYLNGQLAHFHFTDGYSYAPTEFGETDATTGIWKPKTAPSVTYGTNGFFLKFDNSANMGLDSSGQGNNFSTNGTIIQTKDTPSNVFCTMNPLDFGVGSNNATLSLVNTKAISGGSNWRHSHGVLGFTAGKYYFEGKQGLTSDGDTGYVFGFCDQQYDTTDDPNSGTPNAKFYGRQGTTFYTPSGKTDNYFPNSSAGDILMVALDLDNNKIWFGLNGTWHNTNGSAGNTSYSSTTLNSSYPDATSVTIDTSKAGVYMPIIGSYNDGYIEANFGNGYFGTTAVSSAQNPDDGVGIFEYDVPAGFRALCTKSLNAEEYS